MRFFILPPTVTPQPSLVIATPRAVDNLHHCPLIPTFSLLRGCSAAPQDEVGEGAQRKYYRSSSKHHKEDSLSRLGRGMG